MCVYMLVYDTGFITGTPMHEIIIFFYIFMKAQIKKIRCFVTKNLIGFFFATYLFVSVN